MQFGIDQLNKVAQGIEPGERLPFSAKQGRRHAQIGDEDPPGVGCAGQPPFGRNERHGGDRPNGDLGAGSRVCVQP